ncbi:4-hydroxyphenylpyruvate dioxygenase-like protein [Daphnia carinata]|uniref:4-hydroxyphenylpyruvate dioxygenase-like protein n=1 Tax=Daphnia carinata TaxID=120202 RepID=UPI00257B0C34|nr:4-hydroxyphenylpyruvate dioxygenase-like protein [Daphnia carinata]
MYSALHTTKDSSPLFPMRSSALHHIELGVSNGKKIASYFLDKLGYSLRGRRETAVNTQWVIGSHKSIFLVTENKKLYRPEFVPFSHFSSSVNQVDTVFNVALEVKNLEHVTNKMQKDGGMLFHPVTEVEDKAGKVRYSIVGSCCGNIIHTLLDKSQYQGSFLPTFQESVAARGEEPFTHVDHLTYVCRPGESQNIIKWYQNCLGMQKFQMNPTEDLNEGLVIKGGVGMRLRVMDYWPCAESGISNANPDAMDDTSLKIVIAESLPENENAHISAFLEGHGGPGLQHIGLATNDVTSCVDAMIRKQVQFRAPPKAYYQNERKRKEIQAAGYSIDEFQRLGILLDSEADTADITSRDKYLLQIFTTPLFNEETFFMEVMQRKGARGFGAGNVTALARSIEEENLTLKAIKL